MDKQTLLNGSLFSLGVRDNIQLQLKFENWNDFGYYTFYGLWMQSPNLKYSIRLADIHIMNIGQKLGDKPCGCMPTPMAFISNVESAERLFLFLSPAERKALEAELLVHYDDTWVKDEPAFLKSVLRNKTFEDFHTIQKRVKELMHSTIDVASMLVKHKDQIQMIK